MNALKQSLPILSPVINSTLPKAEKHRPITDPRTLTAVQRKTLWEGIQHNDPALAKMLTTDPIIAELKAQFDAHIVFYTDEITNYMQDSL